MFVLMRKISVFIYDTVVYPIVVDRPIDGLVVRESDC